MNGQSIAVTGMGRSGIAVARAAAKHGAKVALYDEKSVETPDQFANVEELQAHGVEVVTGWHGRFEVPDFEFLVTSPGFSRNHPALRDCLAAGVTIWSEIEFAYRISNAPIVAVTGTNGKSTTVAMTWLIANSCADAVLCGNIAGSGYPELTLCEAAEASTEDQILVAEISSFQLEWVDKFSPSVAAITNLASDHLDRHSTLEDYHQAKLRLLQNMGEDDTVVANQDAQGFTKILEAIPAGVEVNLIGRDGGTSRFSRENLHLSGIGDVPASELPWVGSINMINAAMAWELASAALGDDKDPAKMLAALKGFKSLNNRMELLASYQGVAIVNNSMCTNPQAVIDNSRDLLGRQILIMGGLTKGADFSPVREYLAGTDHEVVLFGPRQENGIHEQMQKDWPATTTLAEAFNVAMQRAEPGDTVLLSPGCSSASPYANFAERGHAFRTIVHDWQDAQKS